MIMKRLASVLFVSVLCSGVAGSAAQAPDKGKTVSGTACVREGVESGCLILATTDGKTTYMVIGKTRPKPGTVVKFTGTTKPDMMSTCMQGTPIELTKATVLKMKCPLPAAGTFTPIGRSRERGEAPPPRATGRSLPGC
jgi:hypothetical protein